KRRSRQGSIARARPAPPASSVHPQQFSAAAATSAPPMPQEPVAPGTPRPQRRAPPTPSLLFGSAARFSAHRDCSGVFPSTIVPRPTRDYSLARSFISRCLPASDSVILPNWPLGQCCQSASNHLGANPFLAAAPLLAWTIRYLLVCPRRGCHACSRKAWKERLCRSLVTA